MTTASTEAEAGSRPRALPDPRLVEFMVCTTALAGGRLNGRLALPAALLAAVVGAHGLVLVRWPARRGLRLACFALMLALLGVVPAARYMQATEHGNVRLAHDGGVLVSDEAVRVLLEGRDPYQASYAQVLADWRIDVEGRPADNPLIATTRTGQGRWGCWPRSRPRCERPASTPTRACSTCWSTAPWGCGWAAGACANAGTWAWPWPCASAR